METNSKKQQERRIFDLVYADRSFDEVKESENPDFLVRYFPNTPYFGVEVTECYLTETNARIHNISGYTDELLRVNNFRHKDDGKIIKVTKIDPLMKTRLFMPKIFRLLCRNASTEQIRAMMLQTNHFQPDAKYLLNKIYHIQT